MKKILFPLMVLIAVILLEGCTSGKQAYQKGNYDEAVLKAISRLRKNPNSKKASQTLMESDPLTISWHQDNILRAKQSNDDLFSDTDSDDDNNTTREKKGTEKDDIQKSINQKEKVLFSMTDR